MRGEKQITRQRETHRLFFTTNNGGANREAVELVNPPQKASSRRYSSSSNKRHILLQTAAAPCSTAMLRGSGRTPADVSKPHHVCPRTAGKSRLIPKLAPIPLTLEEERDTTSRPSAAAERLLPGATKAWQASGAASANRSMLTHLVMMRVCVVFMRFVLLLIG